MRMRRLREQMGAILIPAASAWVTLIADVFAHPHMWVTVETTVLYEKGTFTGPRESWTFDDYYTAYAIEGLDKNHDGIYDREELSELAKVNIEAMKEVGYFTYPVLGGQEVKLKPAQDYCSSTSMACCRLTSPCNWLNRSLRKWSVRFCV